VYIYACARYKIQYTHLITIECVVSFAEHSVIAETHIRKLQYAHEVTIDSSVLRDTHSRCRPTPCSLCAPPPRHVRAAAPPRPRRSLVPSAQQHCPLRAAACALPRARCRVRAAALILACAPPPGPVRAAALLRARSCPAPCAQPRARSRVRAAACPQPHARSRMPAATLLHACAPPPHPCAQPPRPPPSARNCAAPCAQPPRTVHVSRWPILVMADWPALTGSPLGRMMKALSDDAGKCYVYILFRAIMLTVRCTCRCLIWYKQATPRAHDHGRDDYVMI